MIKLEYLPLDVCKLNDTFGSRDITVNGVHYWWHNGIDLNATVGTPTYATISGVVKVAKLNANGYGNYVVIDHGEFGVLYAHLSKIGVAEGQQIKSGDLVGYTGNTGASTGPHLHFELRVADYNAFWERCACDSNVFMRCVNPWTFILNLEERQKIDVKEATSIVKKTANLEDKTIEYMSKDYRFGDTLIVKLAKAMS